MRLVKLLAVQFLLVPVVTDAYFTWKYESVTLVFVMKYENALSRLVLVCYHSNDENVISSRTVERKDSKI